MNEKAQQVSHAFDWNRKKDMRQLGMKKERNRMEKAQSRKREPFRIYRASITVEAALLYPILIFLLMFLLQKTITYYQQTDQAAQGIISV